MSADKLRAERDDLGLALFFRIPLEDRSFSLGATDDENVDWHGKGKLTDPDVHLATDNFVVRNLPKPQRQTCRHTHTLPTARLGNFKAANSLTYVKDLPLTAFGLSGK
jgi:hypothetical protein